MYISWDNYDSKKVITESKWLDMTRPEVLKLYLVKVKNPEQQSLSTLALHT